MATLDISRKCLKLSWGQHGELDALLPRSAPDSGKAIETVAFFCESMRMGGLSRVVALLCSILTDAGYKVVLFTNGHKSKFTKSFSVQVEVVVLPDETETMLPALEQAVNEHKVDAIVFNEHWLHKTFFLMKFAKLLGVKTGVVMHSPFFYPLYEGWFRLFRERIEVLRHCDAVVCLTPDDRKWWAAFGIGQTAYIPNPPTYTTHSVAKSEGREKTVLFIGRLGAEKGIGELPRIIRETVALEPQAKFVILGGFERNRDRRRFHREVGKYGIEKNFQLIDFTDNVSAYLSKASVVILPSLYEGFAMVRMEAAAHGVPVVMFSMPYLESASGSSGAIMVGKKDVLGMAREAARLLRDRGYWEEWSRRALASAEAYQRRDFGQAWKDLFVAMRNGSVGEDFSPPESFDAAFLRMTIEEGVAVAEASMGRYRRYKYLQPIDKMLSWFFPDGSKRRDYVVELWRSRRPPKLMR